MSIFTSSISLFLEHEADVKQRQKMLNNLCVKFDKAGVGVPEEIRKQIKLWTF